jgi:hypothetical protein
MCGWDVCGMCVGCVSDVCVCGMCVWDVWVGCVWDVCVCVGCVWDVCVCVGCVCGICVGCVTVSPCDGSQLCVTIWNVFLNLCRESSRFVVNKNVANRHKFTNRNDLQQFATIHE